MSRRVDRPVRVRADAAGMPLEVEGVPVRRCHDHWREWIGVHDGEPERDIWLAELGSGVCELHRLRWLSSDDDPERDDGEGRWLLHAWRD